MFVDSHCHLNYKDFADDFQDVLARARQVGVSQMLMICTDMAEAKDILDLTNAYEYLFCTVGVHPHEAKSAVENGRLFDKLKSYTGNPKVVGLGETGLDYYYEHSPQEQQKEAFQNHIDLAIETDLPLVIHTRDAEEETVSMLETYQGRLRGVLHCFSGSLWLANRGLDLGLYVSISGIVTFKKADDLREIVKKVPLDRLLLETDSPYLAPVPYRGKRNEPSYIIKTAEVVAELKNVSLDELAKATTQNFHALFNKVVAAPP